MPTEEPLKIVLDTCPLIVLSKLGLLREIFRPLEKASL